MKNIKPKYYQLIPENVNRNLLIIEEQIRPKIKGYSSDNLKEIISIVACHVRKNNGKSQLQITYLKKLVPQGDKYLKELINLDVIERSGHAIKGQCSYQYNFAKEYQSKYVSLPLKNPKLIRRIENARKHLNKRSVKSIRGYSEQVKWLKLVTVASGFDSFIEANYASETDRYNYMVSSATRIINGDYFYSVDNTSGRFHSNLTNMGKGLRQFIRIRGEPLINLDISNSQPYLSILLLTNPGNVAKMTKNPAFTLLLQSLKVTESQDINDYIYLVNSGQLYEFLMDEFSKEGLYLTRNETKNQVLRILFARNRMPKDEKNRKARQVFKNIFPQVHRTFSKIRGYEKGDKFLNFRRFSILLQRIESHLMLEVILKRIYKEIPGAIALTIHDSILTTAKNVDAVCKIMMEELTNFIGFEPKIKIEGMKEKEEIKRYLTNMLLQPL